MDTVLVELVTQWGLAGIVMIAAGWIIFDNYRTNKQKVNNSSKDIIDVISSKIDSWKEKQEDFKNYISQKFNLIEKRIDSLENKIYKNPEDIYNTEAKQMASLAQLAPTIHSILKTSLDNCNADHIYLATFHNGMVGVTGIPYFKFDVIAERFFPLENPADHEVSKYYNGENISRHDKLGTILIQHDVAVFNLIGDDSLKEIDQVEYRRCKDVGATQVAYKSIMDVYGRVVGFLCAYTFNKHIDIREFSECVENVEETYKNFTTIITT